MSMSVQTIASGSVETDGDPGPLIPNFEGRPDIPTSTFAVSDSLIRMYTEVSKVNYFSSKPPDYLTSVQNILKRKSMGIVPAKEYSVENFDPTEFLDKKEEVLLTEQLSANVSSLMNEYNLWGCFYTFPEIYANQYSPVVQIREIEDVPELVGGVLTRDMVTACLSYLKRTPILGDFVYIKLDLSAKHLMNIDVLQYYKYLEYLDLSSNLLTDLSVLTYLPYLQYVSVSFNRLGQVLDYKTPQWFLTEVHYKFNSVKKIRDLTEFWSLTILDLSHNNIKTITGLENLRYLRRLDLSFNHIQRLENLNYLRLLWLDVSYNNISSCEFGPSTGLWTLQHLEYLNLNENNLTSMKMFSYCSRLRELHVRNNRLSVILEVAVYMRQMRRLIVLDLRANPICTTPGYKDVIINTFPVLLRLDAAEIDPIEQRTLMMNMKPDIITHATRRLLRLLYIEQLSKARVSPFTPPADNRNVPIVVFVGHEGVGKGKLVRRLAAECSANIQLATLHTTASYHFPNHYIEVTRRKFDDMLLAGEFLTYSELDGDSYGLSREEAYVTPGKVKIVRMDLLGALTLRLRGYQPYLILTSRLDRRILGQIQQIRKTYRDISYRERRSIETPYEHSTTLQVLLSGRIIITGIINEIIVGLTEEKQNNEFVMESECSLMMDSDARQAGRDCDRGFDILALLNPSFSSLNDMCKHTQDSMEERSLYSLFKESQGTGEYNSFGTGQNQGSYQERNKKSESKRSKQEKRSSITNRYIVQGGSKSSGSKSVTFTSQDTVAGTAEHLDTSGMMIEPRVEAYHAEEGRNPIQSISTRIPSPGSRISVDDSDLWFAFLTEAGFVQASDTCQHRTSDVGQPQIDSDSIMRLMNTQLGPVFTSNIRDAYESIHHKCPGLFWDTVTMDDPDQAFIKARGIIQNIVNSHKTLRPMFDIDFTHQPDYPTVERRLVSIRKQIAPQQLFY